MTAKKLVYKSDIPKLERAIELVQAGWCQNQYYQVETDSYCVAGALAKACTGWSWGMSPEVRRLRSAIITILPQGFSSVSGFNDAKGRKKYEVIRVMRRALVKARELAGVEA